MSKKILIVSGPGYSSVVEGLGELVHSIKEFMDDPDEFGLVLFTGGSDVTPELYGHTSPNLCYTNPNRDVQEQIIFELALARKIPMTGICRGSQFLNVMSGGTMIHHLDNHGGRDHMMETADGRHIEVTSTHHQMSLPSEDGFIIGWSSIRRSQMYYGDKDLPIEYKGKEVEAIYYPKNRIFAVQYHPEYMDKESDGYNWFRNGVINLLTLSEAEFTEMYVQPNTLEASI